MLEKELQKVSALIATTPIPGGLDAPPASGTFKKVCTVEVFADPGNFNGEINHLRNGG